MSRECSSVDDDTMYRDGWAGYDVRLPKNADDLEPILRDVYPLYSHKCVDHTFVGITLTDKFQKLLGKYNRLRVHVQEYLRDGMTDPDQDVCFPDAARWLLVLSYITCECSANYTAWKDRRDMITRTCLLVNVTPEHLPKVVPDQLELAAFMQSCSCGSPEALSAAEEKLQHAYDSVLEEQSVLDDMAKAWLPSRHDLIFDALLSHSALNQTQNGVIGVEDAKEDVMQCSEMGGNLNVHQIDIWRAVRWELHVTARFVWTMHKNFQLWHHRRELLQHVLHMSIERAHIARGDDDKFAGTHLVCAQDGLDMGSTSCCMNGRSISPRYANTAHLLHNQTCFDAYLQRCHGMSFSDINELSFTEEVLVELDRKNYHAWLHRGWFLSVFPFLLELPPVSELAAAVARGEATSNKHKSDKDSNRNNGNNENNSGIHSERSVSYDNDASDKDHDMQDRGRNVKCDEDVSTRRGTGMFAAHGSTTNAHTLVYAQGDEDASPSQCGMARMMHTRNSFARELTFTVRLITKDRWNNSVWCHRYTVIRDYFVQALLARCTRDASSSHGGQAGACPDHADLAHPSGGANVDCFLYACSDVHCIGGNGSSVSMMEQEDSHISLPLSTCAAVIRHACSLEVHYALYTHAMYAPANEAALTYARSIAVLCQVALFRLALVNVGILPTPLPAIATCTNPAPSAHRKGIVPRDDVHVPSRSPGIHHCNYRNGSSTDDCTSIDERDETNTNAIRSMCASAEAHRASDVVATDAQRCVGGEAMLSTCALTHELAEMRPVIQCLPWPVYRSSLQPLLSQLLTLHTDIMPAVPVAQRYIASRIHAVHADNTDSLSARSGDYSEDESAQCVTAPGVTFYELDNLHQPLAAMYHILFAVLEQLWLVYGNDALRKAVWAERPAEYYARRGARQSFGELFDWVRLGEDELLVFLRSSSSPCRDGDGCDASRTHNVRECTQFFLNVEATALYIAKRLTMEDTIRYKYWRNEVMVLLSRAYK